MATYERPTVGDIQTTTGVNIHALGLDDNELDELLQTLLDRGEADVSLQVTDAVFGGTLSATQATVLGEAVCWAVGCRWLRAVALKKADGTFEPLLVEDSREISELIADFTAEYTRLAGLVAGTEGLESNSIQTSHADGPADPTFTRAMLW